ncbi:MAG: hypothetical protein GX111_03895 [Clostridiales bacterium]|nr:hypothetical protein [Clostridiales bacterium]
MLNYKKPAFWVIVVSMIAVIGLVVGLMSDPVDSIRLLEAETVGLTPE